MVCRTGVPFGAAFEPESARRPKLRRFCQWGTATRDRRACSAAFTPFDRYSLSCFAPAMRAPAAGLAGRRPPALARRREQGSAPPNHGPRAGGAEPVNSEPELYLQSLTRGWIDLTDAGFEKQREQRPGKPIFFVLVRSRDYSAPLNGNPEGAGALRTRKHPAGRRASVAPNSLEGTHTDLPHLRLREKSAQASRFSEMIPRGGPRSQGRSSHGIDGGRGPTLDELHVNRCTVCDEGFPAALVGKTDRGC